MMTLHRLPHITYSYAIEGNTNEESREFLSQVDEYIFDPQFKPSASLPFINSAGDYDGYEPELKMADDGYGGPPVDDPLMIYFVLPGSDEPIIYAGSLREMALRGLADDDPREPPPGNVFMPKARDKLVAALRELADELERLPPDPEGTAADHRDDG